MEFGKKAYLGIIDNRIAKFLWCICFYILYACGFNFDMSNCSSDSMGRMPQMMAELVLYMANPVVKLFVKQQAAELRKWFLSGSIDSHITGLKAIGNAFYTGAVSGVRFSASTAENAIGRVVCGVVL